jgi:hypothetical protein
MFVFAAVDACSFDAGVQELTSRTLPATAETTTPPAEPGTTACYPGASRDYDACVEARRPANPPEAYDYPPPLNGSARYLAPTRYLDLDAVDPDLEITRRFTLGEVAQREKGRWAVVQVHAAERLQDVREEVGALIVTSGYRSPGYNAGVGGATHSRHMYGDGFDLAPTDGRLGDLADACEAHGAGFVDVYEGHVHCDWRDDALDPVFFPDAGRRSSFGGVDVDALERQVTLGAAGGVWTAGASGWDEGEPLREWTALDADGAVIDVATGRTYVPPAEAATVTVWVGRTVLVHRAVD